jgi:hypothetical protein
MNAKKVPLEAVAAGHRCRPDEQLQRQLADGLMVRARMPRKAQISPTIVMT